MTSSSARALVWQCAVVALLAAASVEHQALAHERSTITETPVRQACVRAAPREWQRDQTWTIPDAPPPCVIKFEGTGVVLVPDGTRVFDVGISVARDANGRFYTGERTGSIAVWSPSGALERTFGKSGQGPGELTAGPLTMLPALDGAVNVFDNSGRWHLFRTDGSHVRTVQASGTRAAHHLVLLGNGRLIDASGRDDGKFFFNIWSPLTADADLRPSVLQRFGAMNDDEQAVMWDDRARLVAYSGGNTFWAGPPKATGRGYELEQWRSDGTRLKSMRRNVPWYPRGADRAKGRTARPAAPPHEVESVWDLGDDLLMVVALAPNDVDWSQPRGRLPDAATRDRLLSIWVEVLDTRSGLVLAQSGPLTYSQATRSLVSGMFNGTMLGYRLDINADEERIAKILQLRLTAK